MHTMRWVELTDHIYQYDNLNNILLCTCYNVDISLQFPTAETMETPPGTRLRECATGVNIDVDFS